MNIPARSSEPALLRQSYISIDAHSEKMAHYLFDQLQERDTNADGIINALDSCSLPDDSFQLGGEAKEVTLRIFRHEIKRVLCLFDTDKNGTIEFDEFIQHIDKFRLTSEELNEIIDQTITELDVKREPFCNRQFYEQFCENVDAIIARLRYDLG